MESEESKLPVTGGKKRLLFLEAFVFCILMSSVI